MKHNWNVTLLLILLYLTSHVIGLVLINTDMNVETRDGERIITYGETTLGERPQIEGFSTILYLAVGVGIGTAVLLVLIRYKQYNLWKFWFFLASFLAVSLAAGVVVPNTVAFALGFVLALAKILSTNTIVHNATEVLMYAGLAVFFAPLLDVWWGIALLFAFSLYDAYAVWHSEHMVDMAKFQSETVFAGLNLSYNEDTIHMENTGELSSKKESSAQATGPRSAILGGGDIAIPLLFSSAAMEWSVRSGYSKMTGLWQGFSVTLVSAAALVLLFYYSDEETFYPAMPFITAGCLIGFGIIYIL